MIEVRNLTKAFRDGEVETRVLKGINLKASNGEFIAIIGRSGAGKSTLMYQMSLLDEPTSGEVLIDDQPASKLSASKKTYFRLIQFGYVFQDYALIPELTALENVLLPLLMQNIPLRTARQQARESLARVGLGDHLNQLPSQLSGGEQQRVSISRAVAHRPKVLFADEPTANLDNQSSQLVMDTFLELHRSGQTIIMVTHEEIYARLAEKIIHLDDGQIVAI